MRILNSVLGDASGGRWQVVCDYSRLLHERGHEVILLVSRRHPPDRRLLPANIAVRDISSHGHYDLLAAWRLRRFLNEHPPDLAIAHCSRSVALLKRALAGSAPVLAVSHSPKVRRLLPADAYIALTDSIGDDFARAATGKPCFVLPNMIAIDPQQAPRPRPYGRPLRVGALGRFDRVKGLDVFIDALGELRRSGRDFVAVIGGAGVEQQALVAQARALGLTDRVSFPGWVDDVDAFLAGVDILCVPARSDAFGLTPLQAACAGVPLVLSAAPGHRAMFAADTEALFAAVDDSAGLAARLATLMDNTALAERLREAAFARALACYSKAVVGDKLINIIEKFNK